MTLHPPRLPTADIGEDYAAGFTTSGSAFALNGPSTLRALVHAPISSALSPNR